MKKILTYLYSKDGILAVSCSYPVFFFILLAIDIFFQNEALHSSLGVFFGAAEHKLGNMLGIMPGSALGDGLTVFFIIFTSWPIFGFLITRKNLFCKLTAATMWAIYIVFFLISFFEKNLPVFSEKSGILAIAYFLFVFAIFLLVQAYFLSVNIFNFSKKRTTQT